MMQKLHEIPDKNPFKVPENYFEELNRKIFSVTCSYKQEAEKTRLFNRFKPYLLIAASVTGFILLSYTALRLLTPDRTNSQLSETMFDENIQMYINDIDIISLERNTAHLILSEKVPAVSKTDIIDYLLSENIGIYDIYEQL